MAGPDKDVQGVIALAEKFSAAFEASAVVHERPPDSITCKEYSELLDMTFEGARHRLESLVERGYATATIGHGGRKYYVLTGE